MLICCNWFINFITSTNSNTNNAANPIFVAALIIINSNFIFYYMSLFCTVLYKGAKFFEHLTDAQDSGIAVNDPGRRYALSGASCPCIGINIISFSQFSL